MKGLDFSASAMDVADDEEDVQEDDEEDEEEEEEGASSEEEEEEEQSEEEALEQESKPVAPAIVAPAKPAREASPEIEGFVKKSGLSAVQPSKEASIYVSCITRRTNF